MIPATGVLVCSPEIFRGVTSVPGGLALKSDRMGEGAVLFLRFALEWRFCTLVSNILLMGRDQLFQCWLDFFVPWSIRVTFGLVCLFSRYVDQFLSVFQHCCC